MLTDMFLSRQNVFINVDYDSASVNERAADSLWNVNLTCFLNVSELDENVIIAALKDQTHFTLNINPTLTGRQAAAVGERKSPSSSSTI